jgi:hypothetical protein
MSVNTFYNLLKNIALENKTITSIKMGLHGIWSQLSANQEKHLLQALEDNYTIQFLQVESQMLIPTVCHLNTAGHRYLLDNAYSKEKCIE